MAMVIARVAALIIARIMLIMAMMPVMTPVASAVPRLTSGPRETGKTSLRSAAALERRQLGPPPSHAS
eukprot:15201052-Alexandrium_andersonii.AAC.1